MRSTTLDASHAQTRMLAAAMAISIAGIAVLGIVLESAEDRASLRRHGTQQEILAEVLAAELKSGIDETVRAAHVAPGEHAKAMGRSSDAFEAVLEDASGRRRVVRFAPTRWVHGHGILERGDHRLLLMSPLLPGLHTLEGRPLVVPALSDAASGHHGYVGLDSRASRVLGLPGVESMAGLAHVRTSALGPFTVIVVSSAHLQRERTERAEARLVLGILLVTSVILGFGWLVHRTQRKESELAEELEREERLAAREERLANESRAATMLTFAAGVAHEVSTPLGVIAVRAEGLEGRMEEESDRRAARAILDQVARIRDLMRRFLEIARGGAPRADRFDARAVLEDVADRVAHRFERSGIALDLALPDDLPSLRGDAALVSHAVEALLLNARDASSPGQHVELAARIEEGHLAIGVRDRGPGIDPGMEKRVLEPFVSTKPKGRGTGLGLAIANEVARMQRGQLALAAREGGGTMAMLRLPIEATQGEHVITRA